MAVLDPMRVVITNFPDKEARYVEVPDFPANPDSKKHRVPFWSELFIERDDFREVIMPIRH